VDQHGSENIWIAVIGPDTPPLGERAHIALVTQSQIAARLGLPLGTVKTRASMRCGRCAARWPGRVSTRPGSARGQSPVTVPDRTTRPGWPGRAALSRVISMAGKSSGLAAVHSCTVAVPAGPAVKVPALTRRG